MASVPVSLRLSTADYERVKSAMAREGFDGDYRATLADFLRKAVLAYCEDSEKINAMLEHME